MAHLAPHKLNDHHTGAPVNTALIIIAITCVVSFVAFNNAALMERLILWPPAVSRGKQYWRLVSYGLVHASPGHLIFNMESVGGRVG